jgi:hypothetical protein
MRDPKEVELLRRLLPAGKVMDRAELFEQLGIQSEELPLLVECLQECGFVFRQTEKTIEIIEEPEFLVPEIILAGLQTKTIGRDVVVFRETTSTNDRIRQAGVAGVAEGLVDSGFPFSSVPGFQRVNGRCWSKWRRSPVQKPLKNGSRGLCVSNLPTT